MPTKKKRIGFIPREDVIKIIDKLSIENNLSNSKIISILVEEALYLRGIFNKKTGKVSQSYKEVKESSENLFIDSFDSRANEKYIYNNKLGKQKKPGETNLFNETNQVEFDLQTYKKFLSFLKFQQMMDEYNTL